jgi:2-polyprenyl-3-methyl-5-hydroxy-6-metoxy-1,4-benzoquinol methylase
MADDPSLGWDAVADSFLEARSPVVGVSVLRRWAEGLPPGAAIVDIGCGGGDPVSTTLDALGFRLFAIDASPALAAAYRRRLPDARVACEAVEESRFFDRRFDGAVAIGLLFLLAEADQPRVIARVAAALVPGGRLLFTAPRRRTDWRDLLTGRPSRSLGEEGYRQALELAGLRLDGIDTDEGGNDHFLAVRPV